jgi:hypothetical protein
MQVSDFINLDLLAHPYNWVVIVLVLTLVAFGACLVLGQPTNIAGLTQVF